MNVDNNIITNDNIQQKKTKKRYNIFIITTPNPNKTTSKLLGNLYTMIRDY